MTDQTPPPNVQYPPVQNSGTPPGQPVAVQYVVAPPKRSWLRRIFKSLLVVVFILSLLANFYMAALLGAQLERKFDKKTLVMGTEDKTIAVYRLSGTIMEGAALQFADFCRDVKDDAKVKAVILRVDSPGGSVSASDQIWAMIRDLQKHDKKIIVSMGGVAASGGYYVSAPADLVMAEETTVTGSIGVIAGWLVVDKGLDKLGIEPIVIKSSHASGWKDEMSPFKSPDSRQMAHLQAFLDTTQARFEKIVKDGRGAKLKPKETTYTTTAPAGVEKSVTEIEPFNGKIYTGPEAKAIGLVDDIGYFDDAIERTKTMIGVKNPTIVQYERHRGALERVLGESSNQGVKIDANLLDEMRTPRIMVLWQP